MRRIQSLIILFLLLSGLIVAQVSTGNIYGTVVLEDGPAVPGVAVSLTSSVSGKLLAVTSQQGHFRFLALPPAKDYMLKFELAGFITVEKKDIRVIVGENITVNTVMKAGKLPETMEITGEIPMIDLRKITAATQITQEILQSLPTARNPWVILERAPGMMMDRQDVGGSESGQQPGFSSRGESQIDTQWNVDGVEATDPVSPGTSGIYYDYDMFEEIQIQTAGNDVTAMTGGVNINFVTRRGADKISGGARFYYTDDRFQADNVPAGVVAADLAGNAIDTIKDYGFNIGTPIVKGKAWFWGSVGFQDIGLSDMRGDLGQTLLKTYNAKFNFNLGHHRIELYGVYNDKIKHGRKRYALDRPEAARDQGGPAYIFKVQDEITVGNNLSISLKGSYMPTSYTLEPKGGRHVPVYEEYRTFRWNTGAWEFHDSDIYDGSILFNYFKENFLFGDHEIKLGLDYRYSTSQTGSQPGNGLQLTTVDGVGYYAKVYRERQLDYYTRRLSAFFQDTIGVGNFNFFLGLRYDRQGIGTHTFTIPGTNIPEVGNVDGIDYNFQAAGQPGADFPSSFDFLSPRLGLTWDLRGNGRTVIKANFAIYGSTLDSRYINSFQVDSYHDFDWYDDNSNLLVDPGELVLYKTQDNYDFIASLDPGFFFDENLKPEKDMEILLGIEREITRDLLVGLNLIYRKRYDLNWAVPYVWDNGLRLVKPEDWSVYSVNLGGQTYYYWDTYDAGVTDEGISRVQQRPDTTIQYKALEFSFQKKLSRGWMVNGSVTLQDTKVNYASAAAYIDPTGHAPADFLDGTPGPHSLAGFVMNSRWLVKLDWLVGLPLKINFAGVITAREGYISPQIATLVGEYKRWWDNEKPVILLQEFGTSRYPNFFQLDLRLERGFNLGHYGRLYVSIDAFNVTNADTVLEKGNDRSLGDYGIPLVILNPRVLRLGLRFEY